MGSPMKNNGKVISIDFSTEIVGDWNKTYQWIPIFGAFAAIAMAFSAGANNLSAPFSIAIGSGALTILKAFIMACLIYVPGAAFASNSTVNDLFSYFLKEHQPSEGFLMWSLVIVLITAALWLALATYLELPVSSQQSTQGALLGTILVTEGFSNIPLWNKNGNHNFYGGGLVWIVVEWTLAPLVSCLCAFLLFKIFKASLLRHENAKKRVLVFLPIVYGLSAGLLCFFVMYQVIPNITSAHKGLAAVAVAAAALIGALLSVVAVVPLATKRFDTIQNYKRKKTNMSPNHLSEATPNQESNSTKRDDDDEVEFENALRDFMQMRVLETVYEEDEKSWPSSEAAQDSELEAQSHSKSQTQNSTPFKELLASTPNRLVQTRNFHRIEETTIIEKASKFIKDFTKSTFSPAIEYDRQTLIRHALAEKYDEIEDFFSFPQLLASSIFALIQSTNEIAAVVSPYGAIQDIFSHRARYSENGEYVELVQVRWWFRGIGGFGAALGFFLFGKRLTRSLGGKLTYMSNSRGLASQLSAVVAMILANMIKLPVSSVHAFVGSLVGVGIADDPRNVNWKLLLKFISGWVLSLVLCCGFSYVLFSFSIRSPAYVVS